LRRQGSSTVRVIRRRCLYKYFVELLEEIADR
jgi:hypothetical protein